MTDIDINSIVEGQRHRHDLGNIKALAESMTEVGLLHPVVVTESMHLIAGGRRLAAARSLGWVEIPVTIVNNIVEADAILLAEQDENTCRKDFTPTEAASIKRAREELIRPMAQSAQAHGSTAPGKNASPNLGKASVRTDRAASQGTGFSASTLAKVDKVVAIAADETKAEPVRQKARDALSEMDRTGKVDKPAREVAQAVAVHDAAPVAEHVDNDAAMKRLSYQTALAKAIKAAGVLPSQFKVADVASLAEHEQIESLAELARSINNFVASVRKQRGSGLRVVNN